MRTRRGRVAMLTAGLVIGLAPGAGVAAEEAAACSAEEDHPAGEWPSYGGDLANSRSQPLEDVIGPDNVADLEPAWHFDTDEHAGGLFHSTPIVARGCVFVAATSGEVTAMDADSGLVQWSTQLEAVPQGYGGGVVGAPAIDDDRLIVVINRGGSPYLTALDTADGNELWTVVIDDSSSAITNASVTTYDGLAFVGFSGSPAGQPAERGGYVVVDTEEGELLVKDWTIPDDDYEAGYYGASIWSTAAVDTETGYAYVGSGNPHSDRIEHERSNAILKIDLSRDEEREATFGQIVASYKGNRDQYIEGLDEQPACQDLPPVYYFPSSSFDATCAQLDLDFGASPNLFRADDGTLLVGALQKSGVYHAADADTMAEQWSTVGGVPCLACNASTAAVDDQRVYVSTSPPGQLLGLDQDDGGLDWLAPIGGGLHYFSVSQANGVVYTPDTYGYLNAFDAESGLQLAKFNMGFSYGGPSAGTVGAGGSSGVAIARNTVYVTYQRFVYAYRLDEGGGGDPGPGLPVEPPDELPASGPVIAAHPSSQLTGYTTRAMAVPVGGDLTLLNYDTVQHDVVAYSDHGPDDQPWCGPYPEGRCPLLWSRLIGFTASTPVLGTENLEVGGVYEFYCTIHPQMRGNLIGLPG